MGLEADEMQELGLAEWLCWGLSLHCLARGSGPSPSGMALWRFPRTGHQERVQVTLPNLCYLLKM